MKTFSLALNKMDRSVLLDTANPYSSVNKGRYRNFTYGGAHHNSLTERGDDKISTLVTNRPWLVNTHNVSPVTRHNKPWSTPVVTISRQYEPHFKEFGPPVFPSRRGVNGAYLVPG